MSKTGGAEAALAGIHALGPELADHPSWHAARAALLGKLGRPDEARDAYQQAAEAG